MSAESLRELEDHDLVTNMMLREATFKDIDDIHSEVCDRLVAAVEAGDEERRTRLCEYCNPIHTIQQARVEMMELFSKELKRLQEQHKGD